MSRLLALAMLAAALATAAPALARAAIAPRASLPAIEQEVMCVTCGVPLAIAESPQADRERAYINRLIAQGDTAPQIKAALVGQFGPTVLALPRPRGFNLAVYLVPIVAAIILGAALLLALPRWRNRTRDSAAPIVAPRPAPTAADDARLDDELTRY